jgi:hypothetical protein
MIEVMKATVEAPPEIAGRYEDYQITPFGDPSLSYRIIAPSDLVPIEIEADEVEPGALRVIGAFETSTDPAHRIDVSVAELGQEVDVYDYCAVMAEASGVELQEIEWVDAGGKVGVEYLIRFGEGTGERLARSFAMAEGPRLFVVSLIIPKEAYGDRIEGFAMARDSFEPLQPSGQQYAVPFTLFSAPAEKGLPAVRFIAPEAWKLEELASTAPGTREIQISLVDAEEAVWASMRVTATTRKAGEPDLRSFLTSLYADVEKQGFAAEGELEIVEFEPADGAGFQSPAFGARRAGTMNEARTEVLAVALRSAAGSYGVLAILPDPASDAMSWLAGKRAQAILVQSLNQRG